MEIIRRNSDYALRALLRLGRSGEGVLLSAAQLAAAEDIPEPLLRKLLQRLCRRGLLASVRGALGGYRLVVPLARITVRDVLETVQGPVVLSQCMTSGASCPNTPSCRLRRGLSGIQAQLSALLDQTICPDTFAPDGERPTGLGIDSRVRSAPLPEPGVDGR